MVPIYKSVDKDFFKIWTREMAYVLGFFSADGYITVNKRGGQFWCIQITDKKLLEQIRKAIGSEHKISARPRNRNESALYRLQIGSIEMCDDLRKLGFSERKTKSLAVLNVPDKYFADFARGYFDGDGSVWVGFVHKERITKLLAIRTIFTSCSKGFLEILKSKLEKNKITNGVLRKGKGNYCRLTYSIHGSLKLYDFMYNHNIKDLGGLYLNRKKKIFDKFKKMRPWCSGLTQSPVTR